ncbi:MAG: UDP-N-acetyl-D-mannosamine dehydrogenase, partial [Lentisphaeria bacterium]|nr:UDP-N-acetyl-D-mannosamine dehydrogenase [Lentisphaeria bacterium]
SEVMLACNNADIMVVEPNIKSHNVFKLTDYREAFDRADIVVYLTAHKEFKTLPQDVDNKIIFNFAGVKP